MIEFLDKRIIVILGMHRSGTSAIASGLIALGAEFGDHLLPPSLDNNERGFWEDTEVVAINEQLLAINNSSWYRIMPEPIDFNTDNYQLLKQQARQLLQQRLSQFNCWAIKDPRLSRLLGFWQPLFAELSLKVHYLIAFRHPLSIAASLAKRDQLLALTSYYLWIDYLTASLLATEAQSRSMIDYDLWLQNSEIILRQLAEEWHIDYYSEQYQYYTQHILSQNLCHSQFKTEDLLTKTDIPSVIIEAYQFLLPFSQGQLPQASIKIQKSCQAFRQQLIEQTFWLTELYKRDQCIIQSTIAQNQQRYYIQLFINTGQGIREIDSIKQRVLNQSIEQQFIFDLTPFSSIENLRLDPLNNSVILAVKRLYLIKNEIEIDLLAKLKTNALSLQGGYYFFETIDPICYFEALTSNELSAIQKLVVVIEYQQLGQAALCLCLQRSQQQHLQQLQYYKNQLAQLQHQYQQQLSTIRDAAIAILKAG